MADETKEGTPETQDKSAQTFAGKFKTVKELEEAYKEAERKAQEESESRARMERMVELMKPEPRETRPSNSVTDYVPVYSDDDDLSDPETLKRTLRTVEERAYLRAVDTISKAYTEKERVEAARSKFYDQNPDLRGMDDLVTLHAQKLSQEFRGKNMDWEVAYKEVARRVREQISSWTKEKKTPLHVEGGADEERTRVVKEETGEPEYDQSKILSDHISEARERRMAQLRIKP